MAVPVAIGVKVAPLAPSRQVAGVVVSGIGVFVAACQHDAAELRAADFDYVGPFALLAQAIAPRAACGGVKPAAIGKYSYPGEMTPAASFAKPACALEPDGMG